MLSKLGGRGFVVAEEPGHYGRKRIDFDDDFDFDFDFDFEKRNSQDAGGKRD